MRRARFAPAIIAMTLAGATVLSVDSRVAEADATTVTFTLMSGSLSISVPASASLGSGTAGSTLSANLGPVTVTDTRGNLGRDLDSDRLDNDIYDRRWHRAGNDRQGKRLLRLRPSHRADRCERDSRPWPADNVIGCLYGVIDHGVLSHRRRR